MRDLTYAGGIFESAFESEQNVMGEEHLSSGGVRMLLQPSTLLSLKTMLSCWRKVMGLQLKSVSLRIYIKQKIL